MKTFKTRHQFYLPDDLSAKLDALTASPGTSKTQILTDALNAWLERKGATELDQRFGPRLDRQTRTTERLERKVDALTEMLGLFIRHQLTLVADRSEEHTSELQSLMRISYAVFCLKKKNNIAK